MEQDLKTVLEEIFQDDDNRTAVISLFFYEEYYDLEEELCDSESDEDSDDDEENLQLLRKLRAQKISVVLEDNYGGEGQGDEYWYVYRFRRGDEVAYVKFDGYYASYCGSEFHEWFFVKPAQKTITVFKRC